MIAVRDVLSRDLITDLRPEMTLGQYRNANRANLAASEQNDAGTAVEEGRAAEGGEGRGFSTSSNRRDSMSVISVIASR